MYKFHVVYEDDALVLFRVSVYYPADVFQNRNTDE